MTRLVTTAYRYKPPPRKRKAVALKGPAIVRKGVWLPTDGKSKPVEAPDQFPERPANDGRKSAIVTARRRGKPNVPDMTPEEFQRRVDAADALWLELVRTATSKDRP